MQITSNEKQTLRELAKRYAETAALPIHGKRRARAKAVNDLTPKRPMVWLHEIPWHEMDIGGKLKLTCENEFARAMEWHFRSELFRWEYFPADMAMDGFFPVARKHGSTGMGIEIRENIRETDERSNIKSHIYLDQLDTMEKVDALTEPVITADTKDDQQRLAAAAYVLDGIMPARLRGYFIYHMPWDRIPRYRGVENVMLGLIDEPELMHATIAKFTACGLSQMKQMEALDLLDGSVPDVHCTPAYATGLTEGPSKLTGVWFRGAAQMFGDVSPAMWEEYDLNYMRPLMAECAMVYYGCCEALDRKIPMLKTIPNLRKIGVSPWANPESCAEQIGGRYVYSHKPNPAHVQGTFDAETVRREITRVVETCTRNNCPYEFTLKDISTVSYKPANLIDWAATVKDVLDGYYGAEE